MKVFYSIEEAAAFVGNGTAITIGNYDGIHVAHQSIMAELSRRAKTAGLKSVLVTFDPHPTQVITPNKAPQLLTTTAEKIHLLEQAGLVEAVVILHFDQELAHVSAKDFLLRYLIAALKMKILVIGFNHAFGYKREGNVEFVKAHSAELGYELVAIQPVLVNGEIVNSSRIRTLVTSGAYNEALKLLGHPFEFTGRVVHGRGMGRILGYPTINVKLPSVKIVPRPGVYAAYTIINSDMWQGMMYIGEDARSDFDLEVNLFDFQGDLYGRDVSVYPTAFVRPSMRFGREQDLIEQIAKDESVIRTMSDIKLIKE